MAISNPTTQILALLQAARDSENDSLKQVEAQSGKDSDDATFHKGIVAGLDH